MLHNNLLIYDRHLVITISSNLNANCSVDAGHQFRVPEKQGRRFLKSQMAAAGR